MPNPKKPIEKKPTKPKGGARPGSGRKPGVVNRLKAELADMAKEHAPAALATLAQIAANKKARDMDRIAAANAILDRGYGKPIQPNEHKHTGAIGSFDLRNVSDDDLADLEKRLVALGVVAVDPA